VFSPYYAWSRWADPLDHCAFNVALYGAAGDRWAMTERRRSALHQERSALGIGPSSLSWDAQGLTATFNEVAAPLPSPIRGTLRLRPEATFNRSFQLDADGRHLWRPIAPRARVEVRLTDPACTWSGNGYFDTNAGTEPLETAFTAWDWSRAHLRKDTLLFYDVARRGGGEQALALRVGADGQMNAMEAPPRSPLPGTFWRMPRTARGEPGEPPTVRRTLEDAPFYSRSILNARYGGEPAEVVHESLSLNRLRSPVVRAMLPFRMPRAFR
jgi:carotenoid 1,2-hydratase